MTDLPSPAEQYATLCNLKLAKETIINMNVDEAEIRTYIEALENEEFEAKSKMTKLQAKFHQTIDPKKHEFQDFAMSNLTQKVFNEVLNEIIFPDHPLYDLLEAQLLDTEMALMVQNLSKNELF